ncbi:MAG: DUF1566 domain-containing protein [Deltaproteobacteria bacterium]|nr:DUF1566 domain-containing protein [Deltaproteobacteria bacterium]
MQKEAGQEQTEGFTKISKKIEDAYNKELAPFIEELKKLSGKEFTLMTQDLTLELGKYSAKFNTYPVTIRSKEPVGGVLIACNANIPIPKTEARIFKQHFENNILHPEISGNFQSTGFFRVAKAYVIDDATNKKYDLFSSKFVDLGNGIVYDSVTNLLWLKEANYYNKQKACGYHEHYMKDIKRLNFGGLSGWILPGKNELLRMKTVYHNQEPHPFKNIQFKYFCIPAQDYTPVSYSKGSQVIDIRRGSDRSHNSCYNGGAYIWPVRGGE